MHLCIWAHSQFSTLAHTVPISYRKLSIFQITCYWPNSRHTQDQLKNAETVANMRESRKRSNPLKCHFNCLLWKIVLTANGPAKSRTHIQIEFGVCVVYCIPRDVNTCPKTKQKDSTALPEIPPVLTKEHLSFTCHRCRRCRRCLFYFIKCVCRPTAISHRCLKGH